MLFAHPGPAREGQLIQLVPAPKRSGCARKVGPEERVDPVPVRHHKGNFFRRHGDGYCTGRLPRRMAARPNRLSRV